MDKFKKKIRECPATASVYQTLARKHAVKKLKKERDNYQRNSMKVLASVQETLTSYKENCTFFFMFGTMLGAYRDGRLIGSDMDIDVGIYLDTKGKSIASFLNHLRQNGFIHVYRFQIDREGIIQDSFMKAGIKVDIAYLKRNEKNDSCYLLYDTDEEKGKVLIFPFSSVTSTSSFFFNDIIINAPENTEQYLEDTYGSDWRIPNPHYKYWENPSAIKTNLHGSVININE